MKVDCRVIELELIHYSIENEKYLAKHEGCTETDFRPEIRDGFSDNQTFLEYIVNAKVFLKNQIFFITTKTRFQLENYESGRLLDDLLNPEIMQIIGEMGQVANSHLMGMFHVLAQKTNFSEYIIPIRSSYEITQMVTEEFRRIHG